MLLSAQKIPSEEFLSELFCADNARGVQHESRGCLGAGIEMQALGNEDFEPTVSLSRHKKEFGEFGGVNASIESSTTFTGLSGRNMLHSRRMNIFYFPSCQ